MDHKFLGDQLVVYADAMYQNVKTHNELAPPATGGFQTNGQITIAIPPRVANPAGTCLLYTSDAADHKHRVSFPGS